jgi:hypothetical protein
LIEVLFFNNTKIKNNSINRIEKVYLICKPRDKYFDEPLNHQDSQYFKNKNVIKVLLDNEIVNYLNELKDYSYSVDKLLNVSDVNNDFIIIQDIPYFQSIGDIYLYFEYYINNVKYVNVYTNDDIINYNDFLTVNEQDNPIISAYIESSQGFTYLTNYLKMFENNKYDIKYELILFYYDHIDIPLDDIKINCMYKKSIIENNTLSSE